MGAVARIRPVADFALMVELEGDRGAVAGRLRAAAATLRHTSTCGVVGTVVGLRSLLVTYDPTATTADEVRRQVLAVLATPATAPPPGKTVVLPLCATPATGPDLEWVAATAGVSVTEVVEHLVGRPLEVATVGHLPGLPYLVGLPPLLAVPRMADPRPRVAPGSVGLAAGMACIYPFEAPGGWRLVGRTPTRLFDPRRTPPALCAPGDRVRFEPITEEQLATLDTPAA